MHERFGVPKGGGIRTSSTSSDIILVRNVHSDYDDAEEGGRIIYYGRYYKGRSDQMILGNLKLARSRESGSRVLYFVKDGGSLVFSGLVECVAHRYKDTPTRPGALTFELERIGAAGAAAGRQDALGGLRSGAPSTRKPSAPDLDMIMAVERQIFDRGGIASRSDLIAALPTDIDSAKLDRILEYLEHSAKISTGGGVIRWTFSGSPQECPSTASKKGGSSDSTAATEEPIHILSMEERLSPDLDNDLPYSKEIEQVIADCEAGRPIGKTYTVKEYLRHLDQEFGDDAVDRPAEQASQGHPSTP